jgi:hypothetical protein
MCVLASSLWPYAGHIQARTHAPRLRSASRGRARLNMLALLSADNHPSAQSDPYSVVLPSKCSLSVSASARV